MKREEKENGEKRTNLIQLYSEEPRPGFGQEFLSSFAVRTIGFAEDG